MSVVVVEPAQPLVTPSEAKAAARVLGDETDEALTALLVVAQAALEPPSWVGASLGLQKLELRAPAWPCYGDRGLALPYGPVVEIESVTYVGADGASQMLDDAVYDLDGAGSRRAYLAVRHGQVWPAMSCAWNAVRVVYIAGHEVDDPRLALAKRAVILSAVQLRSLSATDLALRTVDVPGVVSRTWTVSDAAEKLVRNAVESLMSSFRVYSV